MPTAAEVHGGRQAEGSYRESYLALSSGDVIDYLNVQCARAGETEARIAELDFTTSLWMPQMDVRDPGAGELFLRHTNGKWARETRSLPSGRSGKSWPRLPKNTVLLAVLPFYLAANRDQIESGELDAVTVYAAAQNTQYRLKIKSEMISSGAVQRLRVDLYTGRLFAEDQKLVSVDIAPTNGEVLRYVGPPDVFCGAFTDGSIIKTFRD